MIAFDFTDFLFYQASAAGALSPAAQAFYFALVPTAAYLGLAYLGYVLALTGRISPEHYLWFFLAFMIIIPAILAFVTLPQAGDSVFDFTVILGALVGGYLTLQVVAQVKKARR